MKAIISTTFDDQYLFFLPITTFLWNKLEVDVICFVPVSDWNLRACLVWDTLVDNKLKYTIKEFKSPKHKEATYAQCSRLYAACLDFPEDEILVTSDVDMGVFKRPPSVEDGWFVIHGSDLVPTGQLPMCYISASVSNWRKNFNLYYGAASVNPPNSTLELKVRTYQEKLDELLSHIEAEHFRGNYWGKDQEEAYNKIIHGKCMISPVPRARPGTQFATNRIDRDDAYFMDRLTPDIIDFHFHRPGYTDDNFEKILSVIKYFYPNDDLTWMKDYQMRYKEML